MLKDSVFHGVLHFVVTSVPLTFKIYFKEPKIRKSHVGTYHGCKENVAETPIKPFKLLQGLIGHMWPSVVLQKQYSLFCNFVNIINVLHLNINCFTLLYLLVKKRFFDFEKITVHHFFGFPGRMGFSSTRGAGMLPLRAHLLGGKNGVVTPSSMRYYYLSNIISFFVHASA